MTGGGTENVRASGIRGLTQKLRRGFTLMELMIVVAIIGILGALAVVGVIQFNKSLKVMELNNTAEEIYIAAQNHLTAARANAVSSDMLEKGSPVKLSNVVKELKDADADTDINSLYAFDNSVTADAALGVSQHTYETLTSIILPSGAVDGTVGGDGSSWIIEYDPEAYTVYGVFYADGKATVLGKDTGAGITAGHDLKALNDLVLNAGDTTKITDYGDSGISVGYYGGSGSQKIDAVKLTGSLSVRVVNEERLYAVITDKVKAGGSATNTSIRLIVRIKGETSGAIRTIGVDIDPDGKIRADSNNKDAYLWSQSGSDLQIVLDDITRTGTHFADICSNKKADSGKFVPGENITVSAYAQAVDHLSNVITSSNSGKTNSLFGKLVKKSENGKTVEQVSLANFRHLENLSANVSHVMGMTGNMAEDCGSKKAASLTVRDDYYGTDSGKYVFRAQLISDLTDARTDDEKKQSDSGTYAHQAHFLSWSGFFYNTGHEQIDKKNGNVKDVITYAGADGANRSTDHTSNGSFSPICNIWLSEFDGNDRTIEGLYISSTDTHAEARGLFGTILQKCDLTIKNLKLKNFDISASLQKFTDIAGGDYKADAAKQYICAGSLAGRVVSGSAGFGGTQISDGHSVTVEKVTVLEDRDSYCGIWSPARSSTGRNAGPVRNGGLIGELQTQTTDTAGASVSVDNCSASVYVQSSAGTLQQRSSQPNLVDTDIAGGLIGHVEGNGGTISIANSYAGGHTSNAAVSPYYSNADKQRGEEGAGRNVSSYDIAGGLVGAVYTDTKAVVQLTSDYSTASVACMSGKNQATYSDAGGLIGYISNKVSNVKASDCYSTGLVEGDNRGGIIGYAAYAQAFSGNPLNFTSCRFLEGVNAGKGGAEIYAVNILTQHDPQKINHVSSFKDSVYPVNSDDLEKNGGNAKAVPYDSVLKGTENYPFVSSQDIHYGDWPEVTEENQHENRLILKYNTTSPFVAVRLTGLQSGAHKYLVMNAKADPKFKGSSQYPGSECAGPRLGVGTELSNIVSFDKDGNIANMYTASWDDNWKNICSITWDEDTQMYHYELMLDNVSTGFAGFASLSSHRPGSTPFYYGEYIDVRITDEITGKTDLKQDNYVKQEYVTNTLFEDIFDAAAVGQDTLKSGSVNLNSDAVKNSIKALKHITTDDQGREHIVNIDTPVNSSGNTYAAVINSARHLENLRQDISYVNTQTGFTVTNAVQGCDIIWDDATAGSTAGNNSEYDAYVEELNKLNTDGRSNIYVSGTVRGQNNNFLPVVIDQDNGLVSYNGNNNDIYGLNLSISQGDGTVSGLFSLIKGADQNFDISNLNLINTKYTYQNSNGKVQTFGTVVGESSRDLVLTAITVKQTGTALDGLQIQGQNICGGLVGESDGSLNISGCKLDLTGQTYSVAGANNTGTGGIVGDCKKGATISNTTITAGTIDIGQSAGEFGGLAGIVKGSLTFTSNVLQASEKISISGSTDNIGGLVGEASVSSGSISDCSISAPSISVTGNYDVGGLIGYIPTDNATFAVSGCSVLADKALNVSGTYQVSGMVGSAEKTTLTLQDSKVESKSVAISGGSGNNPSGGLVASCGGGAITNCHISGRDGSTDNVTVSISSSAGSSNPVGGLVGRVSGGEFKMSGSWLGADMATVSNSSAASVGGLIGEISSPSITVENSYFCGAAARVMAGANKQGCVGGLIGKAVVTSNGSCSISNDYVSGYVYGPDAQYAGGLIGCIDAGGTQQNYSSMTNCYVSGRTVNGVFPQDAEVDYDRFTMPSKQSDLLKNPVDGVIGYSAAGGLIGRHNSGYLSIAGSFTSTSVAGCSNEQYGKSFVGGLAGTTSGQLKLQNSYAVSTVESRYADMSILGSFIAKDDHPENTDVVSTCYVISELNDPSVNAVGQGSSTDGRWSITDLSVRELSTGNLERTVPSPDTTDTFTFSRDATLNSTYPHGYPYLIQTVFNGRQYFDGCWVNVENPQIKGLTLTGSAPETDIRLAVGKDTTLSLSVQPRWAADKVTFKSSDTGAAEVDSSGKVTGKKAGNAVITASVPESDLSASCNIEVVDVESIQFSDASPTVLIGKQLGLSNMVTISPEEVKDQKLTWSTSDEKVATVDQNGTVTAVNDGTAVITAKAQDGVTGSCTVTVETPGLTVTDSSGNTIQNYAQLSMIAGSELKLHLDTGGTVSYGTNGKVSIGQNNDLTFTTDTGGYYYLNLTSVYSDSQQFTINMNIHVLTPAADDNLDEWDFYQALTPGPSDTQDPRTWKAAARTDDYVIYVTAPYDDNGDGNTQRIFADMCIGGVYYRLIANKYYNGASVKKYDAWTSSWVDTEFKTTNNPYGSTMRIEMEIPVSDFQGNTSLTLVPWKSFADSTDQDSIQDATAYTESLTVPSATAES